MSFPISSSTRPVIGQCLKFLSPMLLSLLLITGSWATMLGDNENGSVPVEELVIDRLESGQTDTWEFYVEDLVEEHNYDLYLPVVISSSTGSGPGQEPSQMVSIMVAPAAEANILLTVRDDNGNVMVEGYDQAPAGEVETIVDLALAAPASYQVLVYADPPLATDYALMVLDEESFDFHFQGTLRSGLSESAATALDSDDFWFFSAAAGDTMSVQITPTNGMDAYAEFYGPDAQLLETIDDGFGGDAERLDNYSILDSGMYGIRVGEFDYLPMTYEIVVRIE